MEKKLWKNQKNKANPTLHTAVDTLLFSFFVRSQQSPEVKRKPFQVCIELAMCEEPSSRLSFVSYEAFL